jgi:hypothetical protein
LDSNINNILHINYVCYKIIYIMIEALARLQILIDLTSTLEHHTFLNKELTTIKNLINDEQTGN